MMWINALFSGMFWMLFIELAEINMSTDIKMLTLALVVAGALAHNSITITKGETET